MKHPLPMSAPDSKLCKSYLVRNAFFYLSFNFDLKACTITVIEVSPCEEKVQNIQLIKNTSEQAKTTKLSFVSPVKSDIA